MKTEFGENFNTDNLFYNYSFDDYKKDVFDRIDIKLDKIAKILKVLKNIQEELDNGS